MGRLTNEERKKRAARAANAEKQRRFKQAKRDAGYVPLPLWVKPEHKEQVKAYVEGLS